MPTAKEKALLGVGGAVGASIAAWRALFPWIGYDLELMKLGNGYRKRIEQNMIKNQFLIDLFEESVQRNPKKPFIIFEDRIYTYEFVNEQACRVANIALKLGFKFGDTVAILMLNEPAFIWTFFGKLNVTFISFKNAVNEHIFYILSECSCIKSFNTYNFGRLASLF